MSFQLESVAQLSLCVVRVRFTDDPLATDPLGAHDALNHHLYSLVGSVVVTPIFINTVPDDTQAVDITLDIPLVVGHWTLGASPALQMADGTALADPKALGFSATYTVDAATLPGGAKSDTAASIIRKHLNPALKGNIWNALIAALATGDEINWANAKLAFDQLFKCSASGIYLDRRCGDDGITRPPSLGMPDSVYSQYAIKTTTGKLVQESLLEILETFYGADSVRAYAETVLTAPYVLHDLDDLDLLLDERDIVKVVFTTDDFEVIGQAGALEVAAAITRACQRQGFKAFAKSITDPATGLDKVRIYSASLGLGSAVRVTGGYAQRYLEFPDALAVETGAVGAGYTWVATLTADGDNTTFSLTHATPCNIDLSVVQVGDWVIVGTASGMPIGIYSVLDVSITYSGSDIIQVFTVEGDALASLHISTKTVNNTASGAYLFFRPTKRTIQRSDGRTVIVSQSRPNEVDVVVPATTQAVGRTVNTGAYGQISALVDVASVSRVGGVVTVGVTGTNTVAAGDQILVDGVVGNRVAPSITAGTSSIAACSLSTLWSALEPDIEFCAINQTLTRLADGTALQIGGYGTITSTISVTNYCLQSQTIIQGTPPQPPAVPWYSYRLYGWNGDVVLAPDSTMTADTISFSGISYVWQFINYTPGTYTFSIWAKMTTGTGILELGMIPHHSGQVQAEATYDAFALTTAWQRISITHTFDATYSEMEIDFGTNIWVMGPSCPPGTYAIWGAQVEVGSTPNSYVATTTVPVTEDVSIITTGAVALTDLMIVTSYTDGALGEKRYEYTWAHRNSMNAARAYHSAILLTSGTNADKVVVVGGEDGGASLNSIEIYDPSADTWTTSGSTLSTWRSLCGTALLPSGKVIVTGGFMNYPACLFSVDIYDPDADTVSVGADMNLARVLHGIITLADGRVLVCGGRNYAGASSAALLALDANGGITNSSEVYTEAGDTWTVTGPMAYNRFGHKLVLLPNGDVLAIGGYGYIAGRPDVRIAIKDVERFNPGTGRWSPAGRLETGRVYPVVGLLPTCNKVVVAYGCDAAGATLSPSQGEYFDVSTMAHSMIPNGFTPDPALGTITTPLGVVLSPDLLFTTGGVVVGGFNAQSSLLVHGEDVHGASGMNGVFAVATANSSQFTYLTPGYSGYAVDSGDAVITPMKATASTIPGPFIFDRDEGLAITGISTTTTQEIVAGRGYRTLEVSDASLFPDEEGWLCIAFGTDISTTPVRYLGRYSGTALIVDYQFKYTYDIPSGSKVVWLTQRAPYVPAAPEDVGCFYATASESGRAAAIGSIEASVAAGATTNIEVVYPGDTGLGKEGMPATGKVISDKVAIWGGDNDLDSQIAEARDG